MRTHFSKTTLTLIALFCILSNSLIISAQPTPIYIGDNITGAIEFDGDINSYSFCSFATDRITIRAFSPNINPLEIELYDPQGTKINSESSFSLAEMSSTLPISGDYIITVKARDNDEEGDYLFSIQSTVKPRGITPLTCNGIVMDSLSFSTEMKPFSFSVASETTVNIVLNAPNLNPQQLEIYDNLGEIIAADIDFSPAEIQITLTEGCYTAFAMSRDGDDSGNFTIAYNIITGQCTNICPIYEICNNNIDDDGDGSVDGQDEDCCGNITVIDNAKFKESINILPNPSNGEFTIKSDALGEKIKLQLFDIQGKEIAIDKASNDRIIVNEMAKGIYFLRISNDGFQIAKRIIIQ